MYVHECVLVFVWHHVCFWGPSTHVGATRPIITSKLCVNGICPAQDTRVWPTSRQYRRPGHQGPNILPNACANVSRRLPTTSKHYRRGGNTQRAEMRGPGQEHKCEARAHVRTSTLRGRPDLRYVGVSRTSLLRAATSFCVQRLPSLHAKQPEEHRGICPQSTARAWQLCSQLAADVGRVEAGDLDRPRCMIRVLCYPRTTVSTTLITTTVPNTTFACTGFAPHNTQVCKLETRSSPRTQ